MNNCVKELLDLLSYYHINMQICEYLLTKQDVSLDAFQHPTKHEFLDTELKDYISSCYRIYTNGGCVELYMKLNLCVNCLQQLVEVLQNELGYDETDEKLYCAKSIFEDTQSPILVILDQIEFNRKLCLKMGNYFNGFFKVYLKKMKLFFNPKLEESFFEEGLLVKSFGTEKNMNFDNLFIRLINKAIDPQNIMVTIQDTERQKINNQNSISKSDPNPNPSEKTKACYSMLDLILVLIHTYAYMEFYYGIMPSSREQATALGMSSSTTGVLNAFTPIGAGLSCFQYNWHSEKGYTRGYIVSWIFLSVGCTLIALAQTFNSVVVLTLGRLCFGYGGGRALTRKFVALMVIAQKRTFWSAMLVATTCMAITTGPGLNSILSYAPEGDWGPFVFMKYNIYAWITIPVYLITLTVFFS